MEKPKLSVILWRDINEAGAYVEIETGHLYRVPKAALGNALLPLIHKETREPCLLAQISKDPLIQKLQARVICYDHNIRPNF